jgi:hypothetical protein
VESEGSQPYSQELGAGLAPYFCETDKSENFIFAMLVFPLAALFTARFSHSQSIPLLP